MTSGHDKRRRSSHHRVSSITTGKAKHKNDKHSSNENVFLPKKRRTILPVEKKLELDKLFAGISNDPFYENMDSIHDSNVSQSDAAQEQDKARKEQLDLENQHFFLEDATLDWLYDYPSDNDDNDLVDENATTSTTHHLSNMASQFLDQEQSEKLKEALGSTDDIDINDVEYRFFSKRCKLPDPSITDESSKIQDPKVLPKYLYVVDKSQSDAKRKLLLSSDMLRLWYQHGWNCPHSIYQWLMEVVAFDKDLLTAKQAMITLSSFWSNLPTVKLPLHPSMSDDVNYDRNMTIATFSHILKSYGALKLPEIQDDHDDEMTAATALASDDTLGDTLPFIQLEWTLQLMTKSLQLWPDAYTTPQLHYLAKMLLGIGMDGLGVVILRTLQDCFQACLLALPLESWEHELRTLGCSLCDEHQLMELQVRLMRAANPVCSRSNYLCRVIALASLELAHRKDVDETSTPNHDTEQQHPSPSPASSTSSLSSLSSFLTAPQTPLATFENVSSLMVSSTNILSRMMTILQHPNSIFSQSNPDYRQLSHRIYMLDCAIGSDYAEFMTSIENVNSMVTQLQALGRRMGGRLGALNKTKANEAIQRLWSRLTYVVYQHRKGVDDENL